MNQLRSLIALLRSALVVGLIFTCAILAKGTGEGRPEPQSNGSQSKDLAAVIALEQRDIEASKTNDVETLVSLWTDDGVLLQPGAEPIVGIAAIRQLLEQQKAKNATSATLAYKEDWKERNILGDHAYEWGLMSVTVRLSDGKEISQRVSAMRVLRQQANGSWKIARAIITPGPSQKR